MLKNYQVMNRVFAGAVVFLVLSTARGGGVVYVDDDASAGGDGTSWNTAYRFLQDGLTAACGGGIAEIHVGQGTYLPDHDEANPGGTGDREATFQLCNEVALMGGYAGIGAKNPDARDTELFETILTGDLLGDDGPGDFEDNAENTYNVTTGSGTDLTAVIDGFTITAGNGNGPGEPGDKLPHWRGGGMINLTGSPTVNDCLFIANSARAGGGIDNAFDSSPNITSCTFSGNRATQYAGGGLINATNCNPTISDCTFSGNMTMVDAGGGMANVFDSSPTITNCMFNNNTSAHSGGGMFNHSSSNAIITDCTFESNVSQIRGGGMYNYSSSPTVTNSSFSKGTASNAGGMHNREGSNPIVTNCTFTDNLATGPAGSGAGGGMTNSTNANPTISDCTFSGNISAADAGGGMANVSGSSPIISNCTFENNMGLVGGGIFNRFSSSPTLSNCTFNSNSAEIHGGGMHSADNSNVTVTNCTFTDNSANPGNGAGGGMSSFNSSGNNPIVTDCTFTRNSGWIGGGLYNNNSNATITNCTFSNNEADHGGGMVNDFSSPTMTNCLFFDNIASIWGGGLSSTLNSFPTINNCTFSDNSAPTGGGIYTTDAIGGHSETMVFNTIAWGNSPDGIADADGARTTVYYSCVQGDWTCKGSNNMDTDPMFVDPGFFDYRISSVSPCIDAADNTAVPAGIETDLNGNIRFIEDPNTKDTGNGDCPIVDMGSYEFQEGIPDCCPWDLDGNGYVGTGDLLALFSQWGTDGPADFDESGAVGTGDLLILFANWGPCP